MFSRPRCNSHEKICAVSAANAQPDAGKIILQAFGQALSNAVPIPNQEKDVVRREITGILSRHITIAANGDAAAICRFSGNRPVEWKKFEVSRITNQAVTEADNLNGIAKRYLVTFSCSAHRSWDSKSSSWGQWYPIGNVLFPTGIYLELKNGKWGVSNTTQLDSFVSAGGVAATARPAGNNIGLPVGMTRGR